MRAYRTFLSTVLLASLAACGGSGGSGTDANTLVIATVNNNDMIRMQRLTTDFLEKNPDLRVEWVTLQENVLRQRVTTDIATRSGQFDILTIGTYEVPIWAERGWLTPLRFEADYDIDDLLPQIRQAASHEGRLYAAPFYGEGSMLMYRTDLFEAAGLEMPEQPSWSFVADAARKLTDGRGTYGICLRGKAGWGENMALLTAMANAFGGRLFDENWRPQFDTPQWREAIGTYVGLMRDAGPPGAAANGFNENLALFNAGHCAMWIDATVAASFVTDSRESKVADAVGFAAAPDNGLGRSTGWLWAWNLAIPASSTRTEQAQRFIAWATGKGYTELVANAEGWSNAPPGTRRSLYARPEYLEAAPFAAWTLAAIESVDTRNPAIEPVPYVGVQYAAIPEFQSIGTTVGQQFSAALAGSTSVDTALQNAQSAAEREMSRAGYAK